MDKSDHAATLIVDILGLVGVGTLVIAGAAVLLGIVSFAAALGALELVAGFAAAAALVVAIISIVDGAIQRQASFSPI
jgi:hypothetical protein